MDLQKPDNDENVTLEFHEACKRGDLNNVTNLLQRKEEIDVKQLDTNYTLETAVKDGYSVIVELLLKIGVNANQKHSGLRPLHYACDIGNLKIVEILLENGADIDAIVEGGNQTPLDIAVWREKTLITRLLLENGCKTNIRDSKGQTALECALKEGYLDGVKQLAFNDQYI